MCTTRFILGTVLVWLAFHSAPTAQAEMLLVEFNWQNRLDTLRFTDAETYMAFNARIPGPGNPAAFVGDWYTPADVGMTFAASPDAVATFQEIFTSPVGRWTFQTCNLCENSPDYSVLDIWDLPSLADKFRMPDATVVTHVPQLGSGLAGYALSAVNQTIDVITFVPSGNEFVTDLAQTLRFYGEPEPVPEPALLPLFVSGVIALHYRIHRRARRRITGSKLFRASKGAAACFTCRRRHR
jgi:hypothetical protein